MKAKQVIEVMNGIIQQYGNIDIYVQITTDGESEEKLIEGVQYIGSDEDLKVVLIPILE